MILNEIFSKSEKGFHDPGEDASQLKFSDARKTRLTLRQINRLRKMNDMRALENQKELEFVKRMYAPPQPSGGL